MSLQVGASYTITSKATGTVADYSQRDLKVMSLIGYSLHGGNNQQWLIEDAGNGLYYIKSWKGVYLTYTGTPQSNTPITCTSMKYAFRIIKDSIDPSCLKILHPTLGLSMDLSGSSAALETPIILYQTHTGRNQAWIFKFTSGPRPKFDPNFAPAFFLINFSTQTLADLSTMDNKYAIMFHSQAHSESRAYFYRSVVGRAKTKTANQVWLTEPVDASNNLYYIKSATGSYLSITGKPSPGLPLICSSNKQVWEIRPDIKDPQLVKIYYPDSDYLIDLTQSNPADGTPVIVYPSQNPGLNQQWKIVPAQ